MRAGDSLALVGQVERVMGRHFNLKAKKALALRILFAFHSLKSLMKSEKTDDRSCPELDSDANADMNRPG
jgi:hypothetical protein